MNNLTILGLILFFIGLESWYILLLRKRKSWNFVGTNWFKIKTVSAVLSFVCIAILAGIRIGIKLVPKKMWAQIAKIIVLVVLFILFLLANKWLSEVIKPKERYIMPDKEVKGTIKNLRKELGGKDGKKSIDRVRSR